MELRYNAIILKKKKVGETDRLYVLYTREQGKVQLVAKGVRKPEAKLAGQLETLMQTMVVVMKGKGMGKIAGVVAEQSFLHLRADMDALKYVLETVHIFDRLIEWDEPDKELFDLLATYLAVSDDIARMKKPEKIILLSVGFLFQLFAHLGYRIETGVCAVSGERLRPDEQHFFSPDAGGILMGKHSHDREYAFPVSESAIKLIRLFLNNRLESLLRVQAETRELRETQLVATRFLQWIKR